MDTQRKSPPMPVQQKSEKIRREQEMVDPDNKQLLSELNGSIEELLELKPLIENLLEDNHNTIEAEKKNLIECLGEMQREFNNLKEQLDCEVDYTRELTAQVQNYELKKNNTMLQNSLLNTENKINSFVTNLDEYMKDKISEIENSISSLLTVEDAIDQSIARFNKVASSNATNEYSVLKSQAEGLLKSFTKQCHKDLEVIKEKSLDFLKECEKENKDIISRIPKVNNNKYSMKDYLLFGICAVTILFQVYMMIH